MPQEHIAFMKLLKLGLIAFPALRFPLCNIDAMQASPYRTHRNFSRLGNFWRLDAQMLLE
jgi:hypothetical protein